jgi:hypothetical protein
LSPMWPPLNSDCVRYDCRGALSDLSSYEASREGFDAMRWLGLSDSERKLEQLCDKERYHSLHINEEEEEMYKEEEQKRQKANEFQYSYDVPTDPAHMMAPTVPEPEEEDEEYVPSPHLDVPVDIAIPKTVKENARIEKTALFVCKQGPQMEILIKAKQADNPQFGFLNQGHDLYKYYRHVLAAIKSGRYQVASTNKKGQCFENLSKWGRQCHMVCLNQSKRRDFLIGRFKPVSCQITKIFGFSCFSWVSRGKARGKRRKRFHRGALSAPESVIRLQPTGRLPRS